MKCFISYSWDSDKHKDWVRLIASKLQDSGIETYIDQWDIAAGKDLPNYMETCIRECDYVLLICTPTFANKANNNVGGVGYEKAIVTGELFQKSISNVKFIPILKEGNAEISLPSYLKSKAYINFINESNFENAFEDLLRTIYNKPLYKRPPLGSAPSLGSIVDTFQNPFIENKTNHQDPIKTNTNLRPSIVANYNFNEIYKFAFNTIDKSRSGAENFAFKWEEDYSDKSFDKFKEAYVFGYNTIDKSRSGAEKFAFKWVEYYCDKDFDKFKEAYVFGYNTIDKSRSGAENFAFKWEEDYSDKDFDKFKEVYVFGYNTIDKSSSSAENFAFKWVEDYSDKDFDKFKEAYVFGYNTIDKSRSGAEQYAYKRI